MGPRTESMDQLHCRKHNLFCFCKLFDHWCSFKELNLLQFKLIKTSNLQTQGKGCPPPTQNLFSSIFFLFGCIPFLASYLAQSQCKKYFCWLFCWLSKAYKETKFFEISYLHIIHGSRRLHQSHFRGNPIWSDSSQLAGFFVIYGNH